MMLLNAIVAVSVAGLVPTDDPGFQSYLAHIAAADGAMRLGDVGEAQRWLAGAPAGHRDWEWSMLSAAADQSLGVVLSEPTGVTCIALAPVREGRLVAALATGGGAIRMFDVVEGKDVGRLQGHTSVVYRVAFSADGRRLVSASHDRTARVWEIDGGTLVQTFSGHGFPVAAAVFMPDGRRVASAAYFVSKETPIEGRVHIWEVESGEVVRTLSGGVKPQSSIAVTSDGRHVLAGSWGSAVHHWDLERPETAPVYFGPAPSPRESVHFDDVAISPAGSLVAGASSEDWVRVFRIATGEVVAELRGHTADVKAVAFSPDGGHLASGGVDDVLRIWDTREWREVAVLRGHAGAIRSIAWLPDGSALLSSGSDGTVRRWSTRFDWYGPRRMRHPGGPAYHAAISPDGESICLAGDDGHVSVWNSVTGAMETDFGAHVSPKGQICTTAYSPDGGRIATCSWDKRVRVFDTETSEEVFAAEQPSGVAAARFSPDGSRIAAALINKTARVLDALTGSLVWELVGHEARVHVATFSPSGAVVATCSSDGTVRLWDSATGAAMRVLSEPGVRGAVLTCEFAPDGRTLASGGEDGVVRLWDVDSGQPLRTLLRTDESVTSVAFHPSGRRLAAATRETMIVDVARGGAVLRLAAPGERVWNVGFTPDGERLVALSTDGTMCVLETTRMEARRGRE